MAKEKFQLTTDLVKVEPEPLVNRGVKNEVLNKKSNAVTKDRLTINIDSDLKMQLQLFALTNRKNMTDIIEEAIKDKISYQK